MTAPTCQNGGYTTYVCADCGHTYVGDETAAVDHVFENGKCKWCGMAEPVKPVDPTKPTVLYRWEQDTGDGEKMVYLFYSNGELIATYRGETMTAYWTEKDGMVFLYEDAEHTQFAGKATINPDGTVTPWVCTEHNYVLVEKTEASCEQGAYEYYQCTECGSGHGTGTGPLGHKFVDGKCERCGAPDNGDKPENPDDPNYPGGDFEGRVVYTYEHTFDDSGRKLIYRFYENGEVRVDYDGMTVVLYWVEENGTVAVYMTPDHSDFEERFVINKDGKLEPYKCEGEHELELVSSREPNCWEEGYTTYICRLCGHQVSEYTPSVDHEYVDGYCHWCGESEHKDPSETVCYTYVYHVTDSNGMVVSKFDLTFYMDGKVVAIENDLMWIYYWVENNGIITVYEDEAMTLKFGCFQEDKDGGLSVYTCPGEHSYEIMDYRDPTCMDGGYEFYVCSVCGHSEYQYFDSVDHEFKDGMCIWCGESNLPEDDTPALPDGIEYSYKYVDRYVEDDGTVYHEIYLFLDDGTVDERLYENGELVMQVGCYWMNDGRLVRMYFDEEYTELIDAYTIGDDGTTLIRWECKEHNYKLIESTEPTCTEGGKTTKMCMDCGETITDYTGALGHEYDADGICGRCGESGGDAPADPNLDKYKEEILSRMEREWMAAVPNMSVAESYRMQYEMICEMVEFAKSLEELQSIYNDQFKPMIEKIRDVVDEPTEPDDPTDSTVIYTYEMVTEDGLKTLYLFYSNGEALVEDYDMTMVFYWTEADGFVLIYEDRDHTSLVGKATVNEDNTVTPWFCPDEKHRYQMVIQRDPTCTEGGYEEFRCTECGDSYGNSTESTGHNMIDGKCEWCGMSEGGDSSDLEAFRKDILAQMQREWMVAVPNAEVEAKYEPQYKELYRMVSQSGTVEELQNIYNGPFQELLAQVRKSAGEEIWIEGIEFSFELPAVKLGDSVERFIEGNLINRPIYVYYNDGSITCIGITYDMIDTMGQDFSQLGTVIFYIRYEGYETQVLICVDADCLHENQNDEYVPSTCTSTGYQRIVCLDCGNQLSYKTIEMLPHNYVDGKCDMCGTGAEDTLEQTRKEILAAMSSEWRKLQMSDVSITEDQQSAYKELVEKVNSATSERLINQIFQKDFKELLALVHSGTDPEQPGDGCNHHYVDGKCEWCGQLEIEVKPIDPPESVTVIDIKPQFEMQFTAMVGDDVESFIRKNLIGQKILVSYSNGTQSIVLVTRDMIDTEGQSFDQLGSVLFEFSYYESNYGYHATIQISVIKDVSNEKLVSTYICDTTTEMGGTIMTLELYESGLVRVIDDGVIMMGEYRFDESGLLFVTVQETTVVFSTAEDGTATLYNPTGDVIASYDYHGLTITVYGKYKGAGEYIATFGVNGTIMATSTVILDLEKMTISSGVIGGTLDIDEKGNLYCKHNFVVEEEKEATCTEGGYKSEVCTKCGAGQGGQTSAPLGHAYGDDGCCVRCGEGFGEIEQPDNGIEETRKHVLEMMSDDWNGLTKEYDVWSEYQNSYKMLHQSVRMAKSEDEIWSLYDNDFMKLREEIEANCERREQGGDVGSDDEFDSAVINVDILFETNHNVAVGTDVEKFLEEYVIGQNILLYLADGTTKTLTVTRDMIETFGESFDEIGNFVEIEVMYPVDGGDRSVYVYVAVQADFENAQFMGLYVFKQGENELWFELYDNGYAKATMYSGDYSDTTSIAYELKDGGLLYVEMDGVKIVLAIYETGVAEMYQPKDEKIATYTYEGVTIDVYGEYKRAGEYLAVVYDEYQTMTVVITLDLDNGKILVPVFSDGELTIGEDNELYCDHRFDIVHKEEATCDKSGYYYEECTLCGASHGMDTPALGHSYDASGICQNCGRYSGDGEEDNFVDYPTHVYPNTDKDPSYSYSDTIVGGGGYVVITPTDGKNQSYVGFEIVA